ncbi:MAG: AtpZ/AtpI family protein [Alphaproteobacteria bacterium]|nr:AtpZ/AtpI family protein [Alphaproteobacteria bacterium]MBV9693178.1 AtpZ/AtpI family protein [Alphaproteobacteria bacterium]
MTAPKREDLQSLGERLDAAEKRNQVPRPSPAASTMGIAFRFTTELVSALLVGGGIGYGIDWAFDRWTHVHTRPWGMIAMFVLGAAAGILNVIRAANEINAEMAKKDGD